MICYGKLGDLIAWNVIVTLLMLSKHKSAHSDLVIAIKAALLFAQHLVLLMSTVDIVCDSLCHIGALELAGRYGDGRR